MANSNDVSIETILNNPVDKKTLEGFIKETILCKHKISSEQEAIKDIRNEAKDKLGIKPKLFNKMIKAVMNGDIEKEKLELEEIEAIIDALNS